MAETRNERTEQSTAYRGSEPAAARRDRERATSLQRRDMGTLAGGPFDFMNRMVDEMDRTFDRLFSDFGMPRRFGSTIRGGTTGYSAGATLWTPRVEASQQGDRFIVRAELPGVKKDDVQVEVTDQAITIHGERREQRKEEQEGFYHTELDYGQFYRTIPLPEGAITESAQASFKDGVLEISMQAAPAEANRGRRLEIKDAPDTQQQQQQQKTQEPK
jgi:HSP20 family protein